MSERLETREPAGRLGVLMQGTTAFIAAVVLVEKGLGEPVDSLTRSGIACYE
jgi:hypothetical protein